VWLISSRRNCIASVSARGITSAAPVLRAGQTAPKREAQAMRWSFGCRDREPRLAHW
jgi:hypothetical protein